MPREPSQPTTSCHSSAPNKESFSEKENLYSIKEALEKTLSATSEEVLQNIDLLPIDAANIARLHSLAQDAYTHTMKILAKG